MPVEHIWPTTYVALCSSIERELGGAVPLAMT